MFTSVALLILIGVVDCCFYPRPVPRRSAAAQNGSLVAGSALQPPSARHSQKHCPIYSLFGDRRKKNVFLGKCVL